MSTASREPQTVCLSQVLSYWNACTEDAPIGLAQFDCCHQYVCQCTKTDSAFTSPQGQVQP